MKAWLAINSFGLFVVAVFLYLTIRQVGLILGRVGPVGARSADSVGPRVGENLTTFTDAIGLHGKGGKPRLYIFGSSSCGICVKIRGAVDSLAKYWADKADMVLVYDPSPLDTNGGMAEKGGLVPVVKSDIRQKFGIGIIPFGVMVDASGIVLGKGLVNEMSHVESLLELVKSS